MGAVFNSDGTKMFIWVKSGKIYVADWIAPTSSYVMQTTPVLDISDEVGDWRDFGFSSICLDPDFFSPSQFRLVTVSAWSSLILSALRDLCTVTI